MRLVDAKIWADWYAKNSDPYGRCCFDVARAWADEMERRISAGEKLGDCANDAFKIANAIPGARGGVTGFQYGMIVSILAQTWTHGEELRRWHNLATQIGSEGEQANADGGTLNPAMLSIGRKGGGS